MRAFAYLFEARPSGLNPLSVLRSSPEFVSARQRINQAIAGGGCIWGWGWGWGFEAMAMGV